MGDDQIIVHGHVIQIIQKVGVHVFLIQETLHVVDQYRQMHQELHELHILKHGMVLHGHLHQIVGT